MKNHPLTQIDQLALRAMPEGEWFSWEDECLKGINRPHFRCIRLLRTGYLDFRVPDSEKPYKSVEFKKIREAAE